MVDIFAASERLEEEEEKKEKDIKYSKRRRRENKCNLSTCTFRSNRLVSSVYKIHGIRACILISTLKDFSCFPFRFPVDSMIYTFNPPSIPLSVFPACSIASVKQQVPRLHL